MTNQVVIHHPLVHTGHLKFSERTKSEAERLCKRITDLNVVERIVSFVPHAPLSLRLHNLRPGRLELSQLREYGLVPESAVTMEKCEQVLLNAMKANNPILILAIANNPILVKKLYQRLICKVLIWAIQRHQSKGRNAVPIIRAFLQNATLSLNSVGVCAVGAIVYQQSKLLRLLLEFRPEVYEIGRSFFIGEAKARGYFDLSKPVIGTDQLEIARILLQERRGDPVVGGGLEKPRMELAQLVVSSRIIENVGQFPMLQEIARKGDFETFLYLFNRCSGVKYSESILGDAAQAGHLPIVQAMLQGKKIREEKKIDAIAAAARGGHFEVVQCLFNECKNKQSALHEAVIAAAGAGQLGMVISLLQLGEIAFGARDIAFRSADDHGHTDVVEYLFPKDKASIQGMPGVVIWAARAGRLDLLQSFLVEMDDSKLIRSQALCEAAKGNRIEMVRWLLQDQSMVDVQYRWKALKGASTIGSLEAVELLFDPVALKEINNYLYSVIRCAAGSGHLNIVQFALRHDQIDLDTLEQGLGEAIGGSSLEIVKLLFEAVFAFYQRCGLEKEEIEGMLRGNRGWAVTICAEKNRVEIAKWLFAQGPIDDVKRGGALVASVDKGCDEMFRVLLDSGPFNKENFDRAFDLAGQSGRLEMVRMLSSRPEMDAEARTNTIVSTAGNGHFEIAWFLIHKGEVEAWVWDSVAQSMIEKKSFESLLALLRVGRLSDQTRWNSYINALEAGHEETVYYLVEQDLIPHGELMSAVVQATEKGVLPAVRLLLSMHRERIYFHWLAEAELTAEVHNQYEIREMLRDFMEERFPYEFEAYCQRRILEKEVTH